MNSELFIVAAYGKIIPKSNLVLPRYGSINVHPSLLPKYRGPTPIQSAILADETETGVTLMLLDEEIDHGPILSSIKYQVSGPPAGRAGIKGYEEVEKDLAEIGGQLLAETIPGWLAGEIKAIPQEHNKATFTKKFGSVDAFIEPEIILGGETAKLAVSPPKAILAYRKVLALNPEPGTWSELAGKRVRITEAILQDDKLLPVKVTPAGKRQMSWEEFKRGYHL